MKQAIVTGATGFIGAKFTEYLISMGIKVLALGRKSFDEISESKKKKLQGSTYIQLDMADMSLLSNEIEGHKWNIGNDCVFFNLAWGGEKGLSDLNIQAQMKNVIWSVSALEAAAKVGCSRFIQVGTMEEAFTHRYLELDHHINNEYNRHVIYSVAKISAKYALKLNASQLGMDFIYVLHSHVMGPDDDKDSFLQVTLQKLIRGDDLKFSSGVQYFDVISLDDCALGYYLICQKGRASEEYWVGSGDPRRLREYVERMYKLYPSKKILQFGNLSYNDIILSPVDFSISLLCEHTGYMPSMSYEQTVINLYESMLKESKL
jgi:nucleoside-diphosphate-sugar epimerase